MWEIKITAGKKYKMHGGLKIEALQSKTAEAGFVECRVLEDHGSYKKGSIQELNIEFMVSAC